MKLLAAFILLIFCIQAHAQDKASQKAPVIGGWQGEAGNCASTKHEGKSNRLLLRVWYCETDESESIPLIFERNTTNGNWTHKKTGHSLEFLDENRLRISSKKNIQDRFGNELILAGESRLFTKE